MKSRTSLKKGSRLTWSPYGLTIKSLIISALILAGIQSSLQAQEVQFTKPSWYFGVAGGANFNFYRGTTQELNSIYTTPSAFHDGSGVGLYIAPLIEFHRPDTRLGLMLQVGYDGRKGSFKEVMTPCNCPADLKTDLSYITVEPSLRLAPFKSDFYLYAGPRLAFNLNNRHSFTYKQGINPAYPAQVASPEVKGDFSNMRDKLISMQIGAGYDIWLTSQKQQTQLVLSPFVAFHPYFGQNPRTIESWNVTTIRVGAALKLGTGHKVVVAEEVVVPAAIVVEPEVQFTVIAPKNIPVQRRVRETFPIRNYVFFNLGSTQIPNRYVLLRKDQVKEFREDQLEVFTPKELSGRSKRQMTVYYNVINILGDRMIKFPVSTVVLVGSSMQGVDDAKAMAESVKLYLVDVFGINPARITTAGRIKPEIPSEQPGGTLELTLLREGDHRVSIESNSPALLMEFQSGNAPLRPVEIVDAEEVPLDSYATFTVQGANEAFSSWMLEVRDVDGKVQYFGPYTKEKVSLPGSSILGDRPEGDYKITMVGQTKSGKVVKKEATVHMVLWTPANNIEVLRFSVIYEFNNSKAILIYEKYLTDIVAPKIPKGATVIIKGHTDIIGEEAHNLTLSLDRANDVKTILENALAKAGRGDVIFEVTGYGEDESKAPFENKTPEERFYNRTVIIDIIPLK
ncbi:MAG: OmpA family protein [Bacteroidia bacterium]|nr:OmpA family protein [Bacteroidia bacterium]